MITLLMRPTDVPLTWKKFCRQTPPFSIALDGYVNGGPCFERAGLPAGKAGPRINFNHHEQVDRLATRSTCAQVLIAIRQGLFDCFRSADGPQAKIYVSDCDEDICLSWYLLKNYLRVENALPPLINRLVSIEDLMDATAGAYPMPIDLSTLQEIAWIFEPYRDFRISGGLERKKETEFMDIVGWVEQRIERYVNNKGESIALDTRYTKIGGGPEWSMIEEVGLHAHTGAYADGIRAYVSVREKDRQHWVYTVGKMSPFITFDVPAVLKKLNTAEGNRKDPWGGSTTVGGSPRVGGSQLSPREVERLINELLS